MSRRLVLQPWSRRVATTCFPSAPTHRPHDLFPPPLSPPTPLVVPCASLPHGLTSSADREPRTLGPPSPAANITVAGTLPCAAALVWSREIGRKWRLLVLSATGRSRYVFSSLGFERVAHLPVERSPCRFLSPRCRLVNTPQRRQLFLPMDQRGQWHCLMYM